MVDSIPEEGIPLTGEVELPEIGNPIVGRLAAFLSDPELFDMYEDEQIAVAERALRSWIEEMAKTPEWRRSNSKMRKYRYSTLIRLVTGRPYDQKRDGKWQRMWTTLFKYYSSRVQKSGSEADGKWSGKTIYVISPKRLQRPPYSLRLRVEWLKENGVELNSRNMYGPQRDLIDVGHARNPRTERNMQERCRKAREAYRERYSDRKH